MKDTLRGAKKKNDRVIMALLLCVLIIGSHTPINEFVRSVSETVKGNTDAGTFNLIESETDDNFVAKISDSFFYRFIAKK